MLRRLVRIASALLLFALAAASGFGVASWIAPERLRAYTERQLSALLGSPVKFRRVALGLGFGVELIGEDARLWVDPYGAQLHVHRVTATLDTTALLDGRFEISRLLLDGARLRLRRDLDGRLSPPPFAPLGSSGSDAREPATEPWLRSIRAVEAAAHWLLGRRLVAEQIELRDSALLLTQDASAASGARAAAAGAAQLSLERLQAQLSYGADTRQSRLRIAGRLFRGDRPFGRIEWIGQRSPSGALGIELAATALDLREIEPALVPPGSQAQLSGLLTGVLGVETRAGGGERIELDLLLSEFQGNLGRITGLAPLRGERVAARFELELSPTQVEIAHARITSGDLELQLAGEVQRPISEHSSAELSASFRELQLARALQQAGFFPLPGRPQAGSRVESGTLRQLTARGRSTLAHWRDFLSGRDERPPENFSVEAELVDGRLLLDSGQRLESISGQLRFRGDHVEIHGARAHLDGKPLPVLEIDLEGVSHLFATESERRRLSSRADRLLGMRAIWALLRPEHPEAQTSGPPRIQLALDHLDHPAMLWPLIDVEAEIHPLPHGIRADVKRALWAGAPTRGVVEWQFEPEEQVRVAVTLERPIAVPPPREDPESWAVGRFFVGQIDARSWKQQQASGSFEAQGATVQLEDISVLLVPRGSLNGSARLELADPEALPVELDLALSNADVGGLAEQVGVAAGLISGTLSGRGQLEGALRPGQPFFTELSGRLELQALDGRIRRGLPPIVAIALASETLNPFRKRKTLRYSKIETQLELDRGRSRTQAFAIDGPDLRMFASGSLDIGHAPHTLDADVAVFLFRQVDRVLERIPVLNALLLGPDESIMAAYYQLQGPWDAPDASVFPLRTLASSGPLGILLDGVPHFVQRSFEALGQMLGQPVAPKQGELVPPAEPRGRAGPALPGAPAPPAAGRS